MLGAARRLDDRGLAASADCGLSVRLGEDRFAITALDCDGASVDAGALVQVNGRGQPLSAWMRPASGVALHCAIYRLVPAARAIVTSRSLAATVLSTLQGARVLATSVGDAIIIDPDPDYTIIVDRAEPVLRAGGRALMLRGHALWLWDVDMVRALALLQALEFHLAVALQRRLLDVRSDRPSDLSTHICGRS